MMARMSFTTAYNGMSNVLKNNIGVNSTLSHDKPQAAWIGLWDTGATCSLITKQVVEALDLKPVGISKMWTPKGSYDACTYYVKLYLPNGVIVDKLLVAEGQPFGCDILVGMDVMSRGDFAVTHYQNKTTFSFRVPSCQQIDFVNHSYLEPHVSVAGQGRNSLCSCGSGKKYKQCCGK